jgi:endoglucanase
MKREHHSVGFCHPLSRSGSFKRQAAAVGLLALCLAAMPGSAKAADSADTGMKLGRGVNIIGYDPIWRAREQGRFQEKHFQLLKDAGFDHVRVNLHPFRQMDGATNRELPGKWFDTLDWALAGARKAGLMVILDLHEFNAMGRDPEGNREKFLAFWRQVSARYQGQPETVAFEILNEPNGSLTPKLWNQYMKEALGIIRASNPRRTVIVGPAYWNSIDRLGELELPENDRRLLVTVHYYKPMQFTHQGAPWNPENAQKSGIEWLGTEAETQALKADFDKVADWATKNQRPIYLGEFGAYDKAPMASRERYTAAVARAAEARGWSWGYWQFDSDFILYDIPKDQWVEPILRALVPR